MSKTSNTNCSVNYDARFDSERFLNQEMNKFISKQSIRPFDFLKATLGEDYVKIDGKKLSVNTKVAIYTEKAFKECRDTANALSLVAFSFAAYRYIYCSTTDRKFFLPFDGRDEFILNTSILVKDYCALMYRDLKEGFLRDELMMRYEPNERALGWLTTGDLTEDDICKLYEKGCTLVKGYATSFEKFVRCFLDLFAFNQAAFDYSNGQGCFGDVYDTRLYSYFNIEW